MVDFNDVKEAEERIQKSVLRTPFLPSFSLSKSLNTDVCLKLENLQIVGSFKERGAANKIAQLTSQEKQRGVIAVSAGNHAQGVARHAHLNGINATIVMPKSTPVNKILQTQQWGAHVLLEGNSFEQSFLFACDLQSRKNLTFIHPYDDPAIIAGQGTCALEMFEDNSDVDVIVTALGGGGLLSGTSIVTRHLSPKTKIIGVQVASHDSLAYFPKKEEKTPSGDPTIAEGIAVTKIGDLTRQIIHQYVDDILVVSEADIEDSITLLGEKAKQVAEGAGAAPIAAMMRHPQYFSNKKTAAIISGGNIDTRIFSELMERSLFRRQDLVNLTVEFPNAPGSLKKLTSIVSDHGGNIIDVTRQRYARTRSVKVTQYSLTYEAPDKECSEEIKKTISHSFPKTR